MTRKPAIHQVGAWRRIRVSVVIVSSICTLLPTAASFATPPEAAPKEDAATIPETSGSFQELSSEEDPSSLDYVGIETEQSQGPEQTMRTASSTRSRGLEAPVELQQPDDRGGEGADEQAAPVTRERPDPGDGPVSRRAERPRERLSDRAELPLRVWPMPKETYTFTQQFGCVPQLGNLYFAGEGCPSHAPVIHTGIDLAAPEGTPFYAAASGWVTLADYDRPTPDANTRIIIQHDGRNEDYATDYLHWVASYVQEGDYVRAGEPIGEVGNVGYSTGPHLHFSVTDLNTGQHVDPMGWLPKDSAPDDYPRATLPRARMRLPAGTTAGQPESADPSPAPPPVRQHVPDSPPGEERERSRDQDRTERIRGEREAARNTDSGSRESPRDKSPAQSPGDASVDSPTDESGVGERERRRERSKDGIDSSSTDRGEDRSDRTTREEPSEETDDSIRRGDRDERKSTDGGNSSGGGRASDGKRDDNQDNGGKRDDSGGRDGKDGKNGSDGGAGQNGGNGEGGGNGRDGGNGGNGGNGGDGGSGDTGGDGGNGGDGGSATEGGSGGDGGDGGDGGAGSSGDGGDGGAGGNGGNGAQGGDGGDGGDGGGGESDAAGNGTRGGDGGSGGTGASADA